MANELKITLVKSKIGRVPKHVRTIKALGLRKTNSHVIKQDNPAVRGMIAQVSYLLKVEEI